mgnify:CR=1 FL=1
MIDIDTIWEKHPNWKERKRHEVCLICRAPIEKHLQYICYCCVNCEDQVMSAYSRWLATKKQLEFEDLVAMLTEDGEGITTIRRLLDDTQKQIALVEKKHLDQTTKLHYEASPIRKIVREEWLIFQKNMDLQELDAKYMFYRRLLKRLQPLLPEKPDGRISEEDIEQAKRVPIDKVYTSFIPNDLLKKVGLTSFVGKCPFHQEKTPSFNISIQKNLFYCFGCAAAGDAIDFYKRLQDCSFRDAVRGLLEL